MSETAAVATGSENLKRTPCCDEHIGLGAKMVPFAGWYMPVQYQGVIPEHRAVRTECGLFDVSHMGEVWVTGAQAETLIDYISCNRVTALNDGRAQYSAMLNESGGVVDDIIIYRFSKTKFLICVNTSNVEKDFAWISSRNSFDCQVQNESAEWGQLALQGPNAFAVLTKIFPDVSITTLKPFHFVERNIFGTNAIIARTGYSGEDGVEIFISSAHVVELWRTLLSSGPGILPCGLGARDTLRLEAALPLYGHELRDEWFASECGLSWIIKFDKGNFIGKDALIKAISDSDPYALVGVELREAGVAREESKLFDSAGAEIGIITSGTKTPTINKSIAMARVKKSHAEVGNEIYTVVRDKKLRSTIVKLPFYKRGA